MPPNSYDIEYGADLSDDLVEAALSNYLYSNRAAPQEKQDIHRHRHASEHGPIAVTTEVTDETVTLTLTVDDESYTSEFDRCIPEYDEPVAGNATTYGNLQLVAIGLKADYPWTDEAFEAVYWADTVVDTELDEDWVVEDEWVLTTYDAPRGPYEGEEPPPPIVIRVDQFTSAREPNPWEYASLAVPYEDAALARELLSHSRHWTADSCDMRTSTAGRD